VGIGRIADTACLGRPVQFLPSGISAARRAGLDPAVHQIGLGPDADSEQAARRARILNTVYWDDFQYLVEDARAALQSAGPDALYLQNWAAEHGERIAARANMELSNSQIAIFEAIGQILVKPEFR
jgi:hypothetical protein